jgi:LPXTG-site transpeptidase (sortase) family protein
MDFEGRPRPLRYRLSEAEDFEPTGRRRLFVILAILWFGAGLVFLGFAAYTVLHKSPQDVQWVFAKPLADSPVAVAKAAGKPAPPLGDQPVHIVIDKIGVNAEVDAYGLADDGTPAVPLRSDVVAWYTFTVPPGVGDNAVFAGHYTWNGDAVFRHIGDLQPGDRIAITGDVTHDELVYRVSDVTLVDPNDGQAAGKAMGSTGKDEITLITCGGEHFVTDDEFGGGYTKRQIVRAELVATTSS